MNTFLLVDLLMQGQPSALLHLVPIGIGLAWLVMLAGIVLVLGRRA
jgi:hypothetical protein